jgi:hypothetical protein
LSSAVCRLAWLLLVAGSCLAADGQVAPQADSSATQASTHIEQVPRVPGVSTLWRGFNAGLTFSQVHDSSAGWYNVATPAGSYTISRHYSADASVSIYPYRRVQNQDPGAPPDKRLVTEMGEVGDTFIGLHGSFYPGKLRNTTTVSFTLPSGNRSDGLGVGRVTFDLSDHMERYFKQTGFLLDLGGGDSSGLFNPLVTKEENSLGALVHFQAGVVVYLPGSSHIQSVAYEQLPIGGQKVYTTVSPPGAPILTVLSSNGASEDNGITTSVGIPLMDNFTLSGYYNRSLRQHLDTVSTGITYVLHGTPRRKSLSLIDKALREAAGANN